MAATLTMGSRTTLSLEVLLFGGLTDYRLSIRGRNAVTFDVPRRRRGLDRQLSH